MKGILKKRLSFKFNIKINTKIEIKSKSVKIDQNKLENLNNYKKWRSHLNIVRTVSISEFTEQESNHRTNKQTNKRQKYPARVNNPRSSSPSRKNFRGLIYLWGNINRKILKKKVERQKLKKKKQVRGRTAKRGLSVFPSCMCDRKGDYRYKLSTI